MMTTRIVWVWRQAPSPTLKRYRCEPIARRRGVRGRRQALGALTMGPSLVRVLYRCARMPIALRPGITDLWGA